jgi:hypothetical protein
MIQNRSQTPHVFRWLAESSTLYMYRISVSDAGMRTARSPVSCPTSSGQMAGARPPPPTPACSARRARTRCRPAARPCTARSMFCCLFRNALYIQVYKVYIHIYKWLSLVSRYTVHCTTYVRDPAPNQLLQAADDNSSPAGRHSSTPRSGISVVLRMIANCDKRPI